MAKIRFGLIGSGYINRGYAAGLHIGQVPDGELVAIAGGRRAPALAAGVRCRGRAVGARPSSPATTSTP